MKFLIASLLFLAGCTATPKAPKLQVGDCFSSDHSNSVSRVQDVWDTAEGKEYVVSIGAECSKQLALTQPFCSYSAYPIKNADTWVKKVECPK